MRKLLPILLVVVLLAAGVRIWAGRHNATESSVNRRVSRQAFDNTRYSTTDASSLWVVVNKIRPLYPVSYVPQDLRAPAVPLRAGKDADEMKLRNDAAGALESMFAAAGKAGYQLMLASGYRSYDYQTGLYNTYVRDQGKAVADTQSARPGFSEHQTGLAADIEPANRQCEVEQCFAAMPEGKWLSANAYAYGFVIRYPQDKQSTTGYIFEPWHVRFIGVSLAREIRRQGYPTLEEYFGLPAAPDYL